MHNPHNSSHDNRRLRDLGVYSLRYVVHDQQRGNVRLYCLTNAGFQVEGVIPKRKNNTKIVNVRFDR